MVFILMNFAYNNNMNSQANILTSKMSQVIDFSLDNLKINDLIVLKKKIEDLLEQEEFWIKQENQDRYVYELEKSLTWMCDYALMKHSEYTEENF